MFDILTLSSLCDRTSGAVNSTGGRCHSSLCVRCSSAPCWSVENSINQSSKKGWLFDVNHNIACSNDSLSSTLQAIKTIQRKKKKTTETLCTWLEQTCCVLEVTTKNTSQWKDLDHSSSKQPVMHSLCQSFLLYGLSSETL